jgi:hypothetical protein
MSEPHCRGAFRLSGADGSRTKPTNADRLWPMSKQTVEA